MTPFTRRGALGAATALAATPLPGRAQTETTRSASACWPI